MSNPQQQDGPLMAAWKREWRRVVIFFTTVFWLFMVLVAVVGFGVFLWSLYTLTHL